MNYPFELRRREAAAIEQRRALAGLPAASAPAATPASSGPALLPGQLPRDTLGLALSGGGIRSAALCLGVLQALASKNRLRRVDFLSTVSGGGYTGAFLGRLFSRISA